MEGVSGDAENNGVDSARRTALRAISGACLTGTVGCLRLTEEPGSGDETAQPATTPQTERQPPTEAVDEPTGDDGSETAAGRVGTERWKFTLDGSAGLPVADDETVYVGTDMGDVVAKRFDGTPHWRASLDDAATVADFSQDRVVFGGKDVVYGLSKRDGSQQWSFSEEPGRVVTAGETVYVGGSNHVYALAAATGAQRWQHDLESGIPYLVVGGETVYTGGEVLEAVDANTGEQRWRFETDESATLFPSYATADAVYVGSTNGTFYVLDAGGEQRWSESVGGVPVVGEVVDGVAYAATSADNSLRAIEVRDGRTLWTFEADAPLFPGTVSDGRVYPGNQNRVYAVAVDDGEQQWTFSFDGSDSYFPGPVRDSTLYVGASLGLHAVWTA